MAERTFEYRHIVGFEETNLVGNVYYVNHLRWQGRCREMFLKQHAPGVLAALEDDLALATARCACDYFEELAAFDEVVIRMRLASQAQNRLSLEFEYWRINGDQEQLVARGQQEIVSMRRQGNATAPTPIPDELRRALVPFSSD
jgi:enediyne biosynthesis thioesterase